MTTIISQEHDPEALYKLLTGVVVPRPIAWITTLGVKGVLNLAPFSCFTFVSSKPPMIGISIGRKNGALKDTAKNIYDTKNFVVNIADTTMIKQIHASAVEYPADVSEVDLLGLKKIESQLVLTPRLANVPVSLECIFHSSTSFGETGTEFIVGEILAFHIRDDLISNMKVNSALMNPVARLGGPTYAALGTVQTLKPVIQTPKSIL